MPFAIGSENKAIIDSLNNQFYTVKNNEIAVYKMSLESSLSDQITALNDVSDGQYKNINPNKHGVKEDFDFAKKFILLPAQNFVESKVVYKDQSNSYFKCIYIKDASANLIKKLKDYFPSLGSTYVHIWWFNGQYIITDKSSDEGSYTIGGIARGDTKLSEAEELEYDQSSHVSRLAVLASMYLTVSCWLIAMLGGFRTALKQAEKSTCRVIAIIMHSISTGAASALLGMGKGNYSVNLKTVGESEGSTLKGRSRGLARLLAKLCNRDNPLWVDFFVHNCAVACSEANTVLYAQYKLPILLMGWIESKEFPYDCPVTSENASTVLRSVPSYQAYVAGIDRHSRNYWPAQKIHTTKGEVEIPGELYELCGKLLKALYKKALDKSDDMSSINSILSSSEYGEVITTWVSNMSYPTTWNSYKVLGSVRAMTPENFKACKTTFGGDSSKILVVGPQLDSSGEFTAFKKSVNDLGYAVETGAPAITYEIKVNSTESFFIGYEPRMAQVTFYNCIDKGLASEEEKTRINLLAGHVQPSKLNIMECVSANHHSYKDPSFRKIFGISVIKNAAHKYVNEFLEEKKHPESADWMKIARALICWNVHAQHYLDTNPEGISNIPALSSYLVPSDKKSEYWNGVEKFYSECIHKYLKKLSEQESQKLEIRAIDFTTTEGACLAGLKKAITRMKAISVESSFKWWVFAYTALWAGLVFTEDGGHLVLNHFGWWSTPVPENIKTLSSLNRVKDEPPESMD